MTSKAGFDIKILSLDTAVAVAAAQRRNALGSRRPAGQGATTIGYTGSQL